MYCLFLSLTMEHHIMLGLTKITYKLHNEILKDIQKWVGC